MNEPPSTSASTPASGIGALFWQWARRPHWSVVAPLLLIAFTGVFVWQIFLSQSPIEQGLIELNAAYRTARPLAARIAGFSYAPYSEVGSKPDEQHLKQTMERLTVQAQTLQTPAAQHALGKLYLAQQQWDKALQQFETAVKTNPSAAALHNDLGVALLEQAWRAGQKDFARSRTHLEQAIQLDRNATEPRFNLALLYQRQGSWEQAEEAWQTYLKNDARSGWAEEAKRYLSELVEKKKQNPTSKQ